MNHIICEVCARKATYRNPDRSITCRAHSLGGAVPIAGFFSWINKRENRVGLIIEAFLFFLVVFLGPRLLEAL